MNLINIRKMGLAFGITSVLLYLGCILVMTTVGHNGTVIFFNSLLHGVDVSAILRMNMPGWEAIIGAFETFILAWLIGACISGLYNFLDKK